ncbi:MAG: SDR family NAD(P)-dependent oxidoreductase [Planctomycetota bacterium]|nr:SDR family NAD(P)-dependent oxidoreductase [Planctomycetota bacterium]MDP6838834.1 SDR family NAD(P)-dependent oxidoreductase [Planctomycetota bacterium]
MITSGGLLRADSPPHLPISDLAMDTPQPTTASPRRAIVIGASSGIGAALVEALAAEGASVGAVARRAGLLDELSAAGGRILTRSHDVRDSAAVPELFEELVRELGGLDLLIFAAALMPAVERDEYNTEKDLAMLAVNVGGAIAWCNEAAGFFKSQRRGHIVGISSIAADRGRKGAPVYGATKAALDHYLEALRNRLSEANVSVTTIKPGFVATDMTAGMGKLPFIISAPSAARRILSAVRQGAETRYVPLRWWLVGRALGLVPSFIFKRLNV